MKTESFKGVPVALDFDRYDSMFTINCADEDSEFLFVIKNGRRKTSYHLTITEIKRLKKYLNAIIKASEL